MHMFDEDEEGLRFRVLQWRKWNCKLAKGFRMKKWYNGCQPHLCCKIYGYWHLSKFFIVCSMETCIFSNCYCSHCAWLHNAYLWAKRFFTYTLFNGSLHLLQLSLLPLYPIAQCQPLSKEVLHKHHQSCISMDIMLSSWTLVTKVTMKCFTSTITSSLAWEWHIQIAT